MTETCKLVNSNRRRIEFIQEILIDMDKRISALEQAIAERPLVTGETKKQAIPEDDLSDIKGILTHILGDNVVVELVR